MIKFELLYLNFLKKGGREITTAQNKVNEYRRFLYTYTYETY